MKGENKKAFYGGVDKHVSFHNKLQNLPEKFTNNIKNNWFIPLSAVAAFIPYSSVSFPGIVGLILAFVVITAAALMIESIWSYSEKCNKAIRVIAALSAAGICLWSDGVLLSAPQTIMAEYAGKMHLLITALSFPFIYMCVLFIWNELTDIFYKAETFNDITKYELVIYSVILLCSFIFVTIAFYKTKAFYEAMSCDVIYTSDSPGFVHNTVFLSLLHWENDIRQPLFAVFSAPFAGIPYLVIRLFSMEVTSKAVVLNYFQILMLFVANFMLSKSMGLSGIKRLCFILLTYSAYTYLLFTFMIEQYIVAYFWLILCIYLISEGRIKRFAFWGAAGTLTTSVVLAPFYSEYSPFRSFKNWFKDMAVLGLGLLIFILAFYRFDILYNLIAMFNSLKRFAGGEGVDFIHKIYMYTDFIRNCIIAPHAGAASPQGFISWQVNAAETISVIGIIIFILSVVSAILNRDKKTSLCAAEWIGFSVVMLLILGWGIAENGLILYSLYFGWAFLTLMFQLLEKIEEKLKTDYIVTMVCLICAIILFIINIPAITDMLEFAAINYPV